MIQKWSEGTEERKAYQSLAKICQAYWIPDLDNQQKYVDSLIKACDTYCNEYGHISEGVFADMMLAFVRSRETIMHKAYLNKQNEQMEIRF